MLLIVLRRRDMTWPLIGAVNDKYNWVAKSLGVSFVDPNSEIKDGNFCRDGLHLDRSEATWPPLL
jgi:hypothetical protein